MNFQEDLYRRAEEVYGIDTEYGNIIDPGLEMMGEEIGDLRETVEEIREMMETVLLDSEKRKKVNAGSFSRNNL